MLRECTCVCTCTCVRVCVSVCARAGRRNTYNIARHLRGREEVFQGYCTYIDTTDRSKTEMQ